MAKPAEQKADAAPPRPRRSGCRICCAVLALLIVVPVAAAGYLVWRFMLVDEAVAYSAPEQHFKYGSSGGERESGFPLLIWNALPQVCAAHLPGPGYASLGLLYEPGRELPIGMSKRRVTGVDRVFLNCAVCHTSTVRDTPQSAPRTVLGMPANGFDLMAFEKFFFACAADEKFTPAAIIPEIERQQGKLSLLDHYLVYPAAIYLMRDSLLMLRGRFAFVAAQPEWGVGRVDTFNSAKVIFNFPMDKASPHELIGVSDFPSIWNQRQREGMHLHWDGNNTRLQERNLSAAFGTGATPPTVDHAAIKRVEDWLQDLKPPPYPYAINRAMAATGAVVYKEYCADCHGQSGQDFKGPGVGQVTPLEKVGTDRGRLDSYTYELAVNQGSLYTGYEQYRFKNFRKTQGYANMPLDGLWLRAPYLHNGSVPTLRDLLEPGASRPKAFYRGYDVYDRDKVGFRSDVAEEAGRKFFRFDTAVPGNSNAGHEGARYGTELPAQEKAALVEYLKTF